MANSDTTDSGSYIKIVCKDDANPKENRLLLRTNKLVEVASGVKVPEYIELKPGENILKVSQYPDLKYGFLNSGCDADQCEFSSNISEENKEKMTDLFYWEASENCQDIIEIDLRHFDGSELTSMDSMFYYMFNLERIFLRGLDTSRVTDMSFAFTGVGSNLKGNCSSDFDSEKDWDESDAEPGFYIKYGLRNFILSNLNVEKVEDFELLFESSPPFLCDAASQPVFRLIFDNWKLKSQNVVKGMFTGVDFLATMSLKGCNSATADAIANEWLDYEAARIRL